jgi:WXG100 family type VII secretion target
MAERVRVDPVDLRMSSTHMEMRHAELSAAHIAANGAIEEAQAGWVGTSAAALQTKFAEWQAASAKLTADIAAHGAACRTAAEGYVTTDTDGAGQLDGQM